MNHHEKGAWKRLEGMGAKRIEIGGKVALDLRPIRIRDDIQLSDFCYDFNEVAGRSGSNRRHVDRRGSPVFVVTDDSL